MNCLHLFRYLNVMAVSWNVLVLVSIEMLCCVFAILMHNCMHILIFLCYYLFKIWLPFSLMQSISKLMQIYIVIQYILETHHEVTCLLCYHLLLMTCLISHRYSKRLG